MKFSGAGAACEIVVVVVFVVVVELTKLPKKVTQSWKMSWHRVPKGQSATVEERGKTGGRERERERD